MANIPITPGSGGASVATETVGGLNFQQIEVYGGGGASILGINPDRSINASIIGIPTVLVGGSVTTIGPAVANQSVSGAVTAPAGSIMTIVHPAASVTAVRTDSASVITTQLAGSVMAVTGTFTPAANQSVSGAVTAPPGSVMMIAQLAGSILATSATVLPGSVSGAITAPPGSVMTIATLAGSVMATISPAGSITAVSGATTTTAGSILSISIPAGSITAVSGATTTTAGSIMGVRTDSASVITVDTVVGSVITIQQAPSIVGTYAEDAAHGSADKGIFVLGVRNDLLASVTSADLDYSPLSTGPIGEVVTANAPITKWVQGTADLRVVLGTSVQVLAAGGTSVFTYVTGIQVANMGPSSVLVTIAGGLGSVLGYTIAPAGGGSNIYYPNALKTGENSKITASISGTASVLVSAQGFIAKT